MAGNIFISYRRDDSKHAAGRLVDRLHAEFDEDQIFLDVDNIELGLDFIEVINDRVAACDIMLVVIGPSWLAASDPSSRQRLHDPNDFVRLEVEAALNRNIRVIPVLVDGADPPRAQDLPESLAPLANRQATRLSHESFTTDAERLTQALARIVDSASASEYSAARAKSDPESTAPPSIGPAQNNGSTVPAKDTKHMKSEPGRVAASPRKPVRFDRLAWAAVLAPLVLFYAIGITAETLGFRITSANSHIAAMFWFSPPVIVAALLWFVRLKQQPSPSRTSIILGLLSIILEIAWSIAVWR